MVAQRRPADLGGRAIERAGDFGPADAANVRMVQFGDQFARQYPLVRDSLPAPQRRRASALGGACGWTGLS
jgi:hypothetical protein